MHIPKNDSLQGTVVGGHGRGAVVYVLKAQHQSSSVCGSHLPALSA